MWSLKIVCALLVFALPSSLATANQIGDIFGHQWPEAAQNQTLSEMLKTAPRCGETFTTTSGAIYYKPFEQVLDNERCAWIIATTKGESYTFNIQYLGSPTNEPGSGQELVFTGFKHGNRAEPIMSTYLPTGTGSIEITDAHIVVVVFHSSVLNGRPSTGFALQFEGAGASTVPSSHHILQTPTFQFRYPLTDTYYGYLELAAFIFPPTNNIYDGKAKHIWYRRDSLDASYDCYDSLFVYTFNITSTPDNGKWQSSERFCHSTVSKHVPYDDLVLIIFQSDSTRAYNGFWFWFWSC